MAKMTPDELLRLGEMDEELKILLSKQPPFPEIDYSDTHKAILQLRSMTSNVDYSVKGDEVEQSEFNIPARDGYQLRLVVYKPAHANSATQTDRPLVVCYHGGGYSIGVPEMEVKFCSSLVRDYGVVAVAPQYRLAPEYRFPIAHQDAWDSLQWIAHNFKTLGANPRKGFVIGGPSAGAGLSVALSHMARDEKLDPPLTGVYLAAVSVMQSNNVPEKYKSRYLSRTQKSCTESPILSQKMLQVFIDANKRDINSPLVSSFHWPTGHDNLPPTYFQVCGMDMSRDEAIIYEEVLREESGVKTKMDIYPGMPHCWWSMMPHLKQSEKWRTDTMKGFAWLLQQEYKGFTVS